MSYFFLFFLWLPLPGEKVAHSEEVVEGEDDGAKGGTGAEERADDKTLCLDGPSLVGPNLFDHCKRRLHEQLGGLVLLCAQLKALVRAHRIEKPPPSPLGHRAGF